MTIAAALCTLSLFAQTGGIKGQVVNRIGRTPVPGAVITVSQQGEHIAEGASGEDGRFLIGNLADGMYDLHVEAPGFAPSNVNATVEGGLVKDMMFLSMLAVSTVDVDDSSFAEFDMDDSGYDDAPTILFETNDVYSNLVSYGFSSVRFKNRGYNSETQDVYLSGIKMNDAITGYSPFSLWSGLNEAMRSQESTMGGEASEYGIGGYNGLTNIHGTPSNVRPGWRFSILSNSALYRLRLMATYASG